MNDRAPADRKKWRRKGVNVGDVVKLRSSDKKDCESMYRAVHTFVAGESFDVTFRQATGVNGEQQYVLHLRGKQSGGFVLAKPGHVSVVKKNPELYDPADEAKKGAA